jgi:hypothetical protein
MVGGRTHETMKQSGTTRAVPQRGASAHRARNVVTGLRPGSPRDEIAATLRGLAALIRDHLPRRVEARDAFLPWETTAATLLARIARQSETLALLIERGHDLDAEMVMRSLLEHTTLFAWLAITPDDTSRTWRARTPEENTLWWMVDQYKREKKLIQDQEQWIGGVLDDDTRSALRAMKRRLKKIPSRGAFPRVDELAEEVDAHWARRLMGWMDAKPRTPGFAVTFRGHYWTLYTQGSSSVHPDYGAIRRFVKPPPRSGYQRHYISTESNGADVAVHVSISAYLIGDAIAVADAVLDWTAYDRALLILGRWDIVQGPNAIVFAVRAALDDRDGRLYARAGTRHVSIARSGGELHVTTVVDDGTWTDLRHTLGTRDWHMTSRDEPERKIDVRADETELAEIVAAAIELLAEAEWDDAATAQPEAWPATAP